MYCNLTLKNVILHNMALPCKSPNINPIQFTIIFTNRVQHCTTTVNSTNVLQSAWWSVLECVCACVVLDYTTVYKWRQGCFLPHDMVPSHCVRIRVVLCCTVVYCWSRLSWAFGDTLFDHTRQPLLLDSPGIAQYAIAHYTTMSVNSL